MVGRHQEISYIVREGQQKDRSLAEELFPLEQIQAARRFHKQLPDYRMTPLQGLSDLAVMLGIGGIWTKDESYRLSLNSFKVLGGSFALYRYLQRELGVLGEETSFAYLASEEVKKKVGDITFASATDGNHGRGVAWAAQQLGFKSVIYVHKDTSQRRIDAIASNGAEVVVIDGNYDDAVRQVSADSEKNGWAVISDTSWDDYTEIPTWIMQGYMTLYSEAQEQFASVGIAKPTHVFIQAGVGALAASIIGFYHSLFGEEAPVCVIVEPDKAACIYESALADEEQPQSVKGALDTIMAGLACGDPSPLGWQMLRQLTDAYLVVPDYIAAKGMRMYANPIGTDPKVISGESGAVTLGALAAILHYDQLKDLKEALKLDEQSHVLCISTEGDTDPVHYRQVVWDGSSAVPEEYLINL